MDEGKGEQSLFNLDETTNVKRNVISGGQQERGHTHTHTQGLKVQLNQQLSEERDSKTN